MSMSTTDSFVIAEVREGIGVLTLDRPPLNVLHIPMLMQVESALGKLKKDESIRALVLRAENKLFCAGVDVADHTPEKVGQMIPLFDRVCQALADFPVPTLAAIHGHALGGGCELVLCCDLAVMADGAQIGQPEIRLAAIAPVAALRLPYMTGYRAAADLMFTGRSLSAQEALQFGLVNQVVAPDQLAALVMELATRIAGMSRVVLFMLKKALQQGYGDWARTLPEMERLYLDDLMSTADAQEGLASFLQKRKAVWKHK